MQEAFRENQVGLPFPSMKTPSSDVLRAAVSTKFAFSATLYGSVTYDGGQLIKYVLSTLLKRQTTEMI